MDRADWDDLFDPRDAGQPYGYLYPVIRSLGNDFEYWRDRATPDAWRWLIQELAVVVTSWKCTDMRPQELSHTKDMAGGVEERR